MINPDEKFVKVELETLYTTFVKKEKEMKNEKDVDVIL